MAAYSGLIRQQVGPRVNQLHERIASRKIPSLAGMSGLDVKEWQRSNEILCCLRSHMLDLGYQPIDTPLLEQTELFVRKSGGDLAGRLYNFKDPGGTDVSLRPEFTSSVIRHFVDSEAALTLPVRWQYSGPVFRYMPSELGQYRQFTQSGAELLGAGGDDADIEVISLAASGLKELGLVDFRLRLGHLGVLHDLLDSFGISDPAKLFIIGNMSALRDGETDVDALLMHASEVGLIGRSVELVSNLESALERMSTESAEDFIHGVLRESMPEPLGRRTTDQIIARLLSKVRQANCPEAFERALTLASRLATPAGEPRAALQTARAAALESGVEDTPLDAIETLLSQTPRVGVPESRIDLELGMARGVSYYTGIIFEFVSDGNGLKAYGGGGRYDGLVQALGGSKDIPALGFAYNVDLLLDTLAANGVQTDGV